MKIELIEKFENLNILFNMGDFFSREIKNTRCSILFNDELPEDPYLNYATKIKIKGNTAQAIKEIESIFVKHKSKPSFHILPYSYPKNLGSLLKKMGYKPFAIDSWMFFDLEKNTERSETSVKIKKTGASEIQEFKHVFNEVYMNGEEDDPYKNLSHLYGEFMVRRFGAKKKECETEHYSAFIGNKMVGVIALEHDKKIAGLYALAVLPEYRNMGAGRTLLVACIERAKELKLGHIFLQTEKGSRNEKIFKKIGFKTKFVGELLSKQ